MRWDGTVALITGASRGIGRAVALAASRRGARVGLVARSEEDLRGVLSACGGRGVVAAADVTDRAAVEAAVARVREALGPVDVLVNNAGAGAWGRFSDTDPQTFEQMLRVNYLSAVWVTQAVLADMLQRRRGHIVNVASVAGRVAAPLEAAYSAAKFALAGLTDALGVELAPHGIGVSLINPGPVDTAFFEARGHPYTRRFPRPVPPERVAEAVIAAVERGTVERFVPPWLRWPPLLRAATPRGFRAGTLRSFRRELG